MMSMMTPLTLGAAETTRDVRREEITIIKIGVTNMEKFLQKMD